MSDLSTQTPAEIDAALADLWSTEQTYRGYADAERRYLADAERRGETRRAAEMQNILDGYDAKIEAARNAARPYEAEYAARGGWLRYFIVNNTGGHVHRGMNCSTCFDTTQFGWLPSLSDCVESEMVAEYGEMACTICFPDAPTMSGFGDGTSALARYSAAEKAERAAAKAERAAKKAAKTLDEPVVVHQSQRFSETLRSVYDAKTWLKGAIDYRALGYSQYLNDETVADMSRVADALRSKGLDVDTMIAKWTKAAR